MRSIVKAAARLQAGSRRSGKALLVGIASCALALAASASGAALADENTLESHGIDSGLIGENCPPEIREAMAEAARAGTDQAAIRWEKSIRRPQELGELSCLDGIMNRDLGILVSMPSIDDLFGNIQEAVCQAAEEGWRQATSRVAGAVGDVGVPGLELPGGLGGISGGGISLERTNNPLTVRGGSLPSLPSIGSPPINGGASGGSQGSSSNGTFDFLKSIYR